MVLSAELPTFSLQRWHALRDQQLHREQKLFSYRRKPLHGRSVHHDKPVDVELDVDPDMVLVPDVDLVSVQDADLVSVLDADLVSVPVLAQDADLVLVQDADSVLVQVFFQEVDLLDREDVVPELDAALHLLVSGPVR